MRISDIHIDGYGVFHNVAWSDLPPGLALLRGDNEAGKSTLLNLIRDVLFGFPRKSRSRSDYAPQAGGGKKGRLTVVTDAGERYAIEREEAVRGGVVTVTSADGGFEGPEALGRLLGGTTRELYTNVFAFSLQELQELDTEIDAVHRQHDDRGRDHHGGTRQEKVALPHEVEVGVDQNLEHVRSLLDAQGLDPAPTTSQDSISCRN